MIKYQVLKNQTKKIILDKSGEYVVELAGDGARAEVLGGFLLGGSEKLDLKLRIIHKAEHTFADTLVKVVLDGKSQADIRGMIVVEKGGQHTESFLNENVLMLSDDCRALAIPDLEIEANEVSCSHAATVGKIDSEQVFYLMSRGVSEVEAKKIVVDGFLQEVFDRIGFNSQLPLRKISG